jgi:hypothetical protein
VNGLLFPYRSTESAFLVLIAACFVLFGCDRKSGANTADQAVRSAYLELEDAIQKGDSAKWLSLQSSTQLARLKPADREQIAKEMRGRPELRFAIVAAAADGDRGAVIGQMDFGKADDASFETARFVRENGAWKVDEEAFSNTPIDPRSLFAVVPPGNGSFAKSGSPWERVPYARVNTQWYKLEQLDWKLQAVEDSSYLYLRFEAKTPLLPSGTELPGGRPQVPPSPATLKIRADEGGAVSSFEIQTDCGIQTRSTFGDTGRATSNRFYMIYSIYVRGAGDTMIFTTHTEDSARLVSAHDRFLDLRIPLGALGLGSAGLPKIVLEEVNAPGKLLPYDVGSF